MISGVLIVHRVIPDLVLFLLLAAVFLLTLGVALTLTTEVPGFEDLPLLLA